MFIGIFVLFIIIYKDHVYTQKADKILVESWFIRIYQEKKEINYPYLQKHQQVFRANKDNMKHR